MPIRESETEKLLQKARNMLKMSYAPYSHFNVGAALLCKDGKIFGGCNIENSSYGATNCAERTAFFNAISQGERDFVAIAIVGGKDGILNDFCSPCGICRQVMMEWTNPKEFVIILQNKKGETKQFLLEELLPLAFGPSSLKN